MENIQTNLKNISKTIYEMRNRNVIINNLKSEVIYILYLLCNVQIINKENNLKLLNNEIDHTKDPELLKSLLNEYYKSLNFNMENIKVY